MLKSKLVLLVLVVSFSSGCSTLNNNMLKSEKIESVKKIAIFTYMKDDKAAIIDRTEIMNKTYTYGQFGAIGGLIEGAILSIEANDAISKSLKGDPKVLEQILGKYSINESLNNLIKDRFENKYQVVTSEYFYENCKNKCEKYKIGDLIELSKESDADLLLRIDYVFGLAAYKDRNAAAVVQGHLRVFDVASGKKLIEKDMLSDDYFEQNKILAEYIDNDAEVFKQSIKEAAKVFSLQIAEVFGFGSDSLVRTKNESQLSGNLYREDELELTAEYFPYISLSCKKPKRLKQDCSMMVGPKTLIELGGVKAKLAASEDGKTILIMDDHPFTKLGEVTQDIRDAYSQVKTKLKENDINIVSIIKIGKSRAIDGYILDLDSDGYSVLKKFKK